MLSPRRESLHSDGITDQKSLQRTSAKKSPRKRQIIALQRNGPCVDGSSWQLAYAAGGSCSFNRAKILPTVRRSARCVEYSYARDIGAQRTGVVPVVGQLETARMAQHVRVRQPDGWRPGRCAQAGRAEWVAVLGRENERRFRSLFALQAPLQLCRREQ